MSYAKRFKKRKELLENLKKRDLPLLSEHKNQPSKLKLDFGLASQIYSQNEEFYSFAHDFSDITQAEVEEFLERFKKDFKEQYQEEINKEIQEQCKQMEKTIDRCIPLLPDLIKMIEKMTEKDAPKSIDKEKIIDQEKIEVLLPFIKPLCSLCVEYNTYKKYDKKAMQELIKQTHEKMSQIENLLQTAL